MKLRHALFTIVLLGPLAVSCAKKPADLSYDSTSTTQMARSGQGNGVIRGIGSNGQSVVLDHGNVPDVMDSMTMDYHVDKPEILQGLKVGDSVTFTLSMPHPGEYVVTQISKR